MSKSAFSGAEFIAAAASVPIETERFVPWNLNQRAR
jgi:hypothetical protein